MKYLLWPLLCLSITLGAQSSEEITGVWRVISNSWSEDTKQYADCEMIKFITNHRWATLFYRRATDEFVGSGGGTYEWIDGNYVETVEYFSWDPSAVGSQQSYSLKVVDGKLIQEGQLQTSKYDYLLYTVHERLDELSNAYTTTSTPQGIWQLVKATYGEEQVDDIDAVTAKYGSVVKIITPKFFIGTFYNNQKLSVDGVTFGTYRIADGKYTETVKHWSWEDKSLVGTQPSFDWEINSSGNFVQHGNLNSDQYDNYVIHEEFERIEPIVPRKKYWTENDRQTLLDNLIRSRKEMEALTENLSDEQWHYKRDENSWTIAQVVEHISLYDRFVIQEARVSFNLPPRPELAATTFRDDRYTEWMAETNPHVSPTNGVPQGLMKGSDNLIFFRYARDLLEDLVRNTDKDLRTHFTPRGSEASKHRSIHGLLTVHYGHTDRHIRQVKRILADKGFPVDKS